MAAPFFQEVRRMRCLYCGIKLKIAREAKLIRHCPECSTSIECESPQEARLLSIVSVDVKEPRKEIQLHRTAAASAFLHH